MSLAKAVRKPDRVALLLPPRLLTRLLKLLSSALRVVSLVLLVLLELLLSEALLEVLLVLEVLLALAEASFWIRLCRSDWI